MESSKGIFCMYLNFPSLGFDPETQEALLVLTSWFIIVEFAKTTKNAIGKLN